VVEVKFYYSLGSRYSYLAYSQLDSVAAETGCSFVYCPVDGGSLPCRREMNPFRGAPVSGQYQWDYRERDAARWAQLYGVPYVEPRGRVQFDSTALALAAVAAMRLGIVKQYADELFSALFVEPGVTLLDRTEFIERAQRCGVARAEFEAALDSDATLVAHADLLQAADRAGVFGIPSFVIGSELFWGNDRLVLLKDYLQRQPPKDSNGV
jgi:2-hydroxychromene-2-carboxylate isomerase